MEAIFFIGIIIIPIVKILKRFFPVIHDELTMVAAILTGIVISLIGPWIGVEPITVAQGIAAGLTAIGVVSAADRAASK